MTCLPRFKRFLARRLDIFLSCFCMVFFFYSHLLSVSIRAYRICFSSCIDFRHTDLEVDILAPAIILKIPHACCQYHLLPLDYNYIRNHLSRQEKRRVLKVYSPNGELGQKPIMIAEPGRRPLGLDAPPNAKSFYGDWRQISQEQNLVKSPGWVSPTRRLITPCMSVYWKSLWMHHFPCVSESQRRWCWIVCGSNSIHIPSNQSSIGRKKKL